MNTEIKKMGIFALLVVALFAFAGFAEAAITISSTELNGREVYDSSDARNLIRNFGRNSEIEVSVELSSDVDAKNVQIEAVISGLEHDADDARDRTEVFDVKAGVTYVKDLTIKLPSRMDMQTTYRLRVRVEDQNSVGTYKDYFLYVDSNLRGIEVKDVLFSPEYEVVAGRSLLTEVQLRNIGTRDESNIKIRVAIPDLGVSKTTIMSNLDSDDIDVTEPLFIRIPDCATKGLYEVVITVEYNDGDEVTTTKKVMKVAESETCQTLPTSSTSQSGKTVVSLPSMQNVKVGEETVFPVLVTNGASSAKTYNVYVRGLEGWATYRMEPAMSQIISGGQTTPVYVYVKANKDAAAGQRTFFLEIQTGDETKQLPLTANLVKESVSVWSGVKKALEVGLIIFVVLLVVLGLVIGYNKMKENNGNEELDSEEGSSQTYY